MTPGVADCAASGELWRALRAHGAPPAPPCPRCGYGFPIAPGCLAACIAAIPPDACPRCAQPCTGGVCRSLGCARRWCPIRRTHVVLGYKKGDVERLVRAAKRVERWAVVALARALAGWLLDAAGRSAYDLVVPVPFHRAALRGRAAHPLTAIYMDALPAVRTDVPVDDLTPALLVQTSPRPARRLQSEQARWDSVRGTVRLAYPTRLLRGARVLVVDDVLTSGATVSECARVMLDDGGTAVVDAVVLARQPWRMRPSPPSGTSPRDARASRPSLSGPPAETRAGVQTACAGGVDDVAARRGQR